MRTAPILALLLAGPLAVHAQSTTPPADGSRVEITFASIDRNADRRISRTEAGYYKYLIDRYCKQHAPQLRTLEVRFPSDLRQPVPSLKRWHLWHDDVRRAVPTPFRHQRFACHRLNRTPS
jgi:hypothetical protein